MLQPLKDSFEFNVFEKTLVILYGKRLCLNVLKTHFNDRDVSRNFKKDKIKITSTNYELEKNGIFNGKR